MDGMEHAWPNLGGDVDRNQESTMIKVFAISAAALLATQASAAVVINNLGTVTVPPTASYSPGAIFGHGINSGYYEFSIASPMVLAASNFNNQGIGPKGNFDFTSINLYSGTGIGGTVLQTGTVTPRSKGFELASLSTYKLTNGAYTIAYTGSAPGVTASVGSSITFAAGSVPEPMTWTMLVAGFGLVGASVRGRSRTMVAV